jgi:hypothetical protein
MLLVDKFLEAHRRPPAQMILDLDATDDPMIRCTRKVGFLHGYGDCGDRTSMHLPERPGRLPGS